MVNSKSIFQQDNCPAHKSKGVSKWFTENEIKLLIWPPQSLDLNIIENVWAALTSYVLWQWQAVLYKILFKSCNSKILEQFGSFIYTIAVFKGPEKAYSLFKQ